MKVVNPRKHADVHSSHRGKIEGITCDHTVGHVEKALLFLSSRERRISFPSVRGMFGTQVQNCKNRSYVQVKATYSVLDALTIFERAFYIVLSLRLDSVVYPRGKSVSGKACFQCCSRIEVRRSVTKRHNTGLLYLVVAAFHKL